MRKCARGAPEEYRGTGALESRVRIASSTVQIYDAAVIHRNHPPTTRLPRPHAVIIAGPNGAGKTTLAPHLLAGELGVRTFVNVDILAQGLAGFDPASAAVQAGRVMHRWLDELRRARVDFAFETTLSGLSLRRTIADLHAADYRTFLVYFWLSDPETAVERVRGRVRLGGHDVPERDVRRRFFRSVHNLSMCTGESCRSGGCTTQAVH